MDEKKHKIISQNAVATLLIALVAIMIVLACALSPIFVLKTITIRGCQFVPEDDIVRIAGVNKGENLFQLQTDEIKKTLLKDLRIENVMVQRIFPSELEIDVTERPPLAMVRCDYGYLELGKGGIVLDAHRTLRDMPVPVISGTSVSDLFVGDVVEDKATNQVLDFLASLDTGTVKCLSEINISNPDNVMLYAGSVQIRIGSIEKLPEKLKVTKSVLTELQQTKHPIEYVDARFEAYSVRLRQ